VKVMIPAILLVATALTAPMASAVVCPPQAEDLYRRAQAADSQDRLEDARSLYAQAAEVCDRSEYWMSLGDLWFNDFLGDSAEDVNAEGKPALDAYTSALEAAQREGNKVRGAAAARSLVNFGIRAGDPINAKKFLILASQLDPDHPELPPLQDEVDYLQAELSTDELETSLSTTRGLGVASDILAKAGDACSFWSEELCNPGAETSDADATPSPDKPSGRSIDIPINFQLNSTETTAATASNIVNLAKVLANQPEGQQILLLGHADARGDANYNMNLSQQRAAAVRDQLTALQPSLAGRIEAEGRGELEPIDAGTSERAYNNNRRLEIIILQ